MKMEQVIGSVPDVIPAKATNLPDNLSPQCIGREFVRCYYTLLHDNPNKLHRFYLDQSTFVHGNQTDETAECVSGQRAIHEKIMSLNFVDCRTKIKHVDSQPTIDNGVVVQVSGELSNGGKIPRRFMQTFVLGSQTPRKYYVHNDIFRYQDEVFGCDQDDAVDDEDNSLSSQEDINDHLDDELSQPKYEDTFKPEHHEEKTNGNVPETDVLSNNHDLPGEEPVNHLHDILPEIQPEPEPIAVEPEEIAETSSVPEDPEIEEPTPEPEPEEPAEEVVPEEPAEPEPEIPKGPKSWAMIAGSGSTPAPARVTPTQSTPPKPKPAPEPKELPKKETSFQPFTKEPEKVDGGRGGRRSNKTESRGFNNFSKERFQERDAPNAHQIFVGNLPHNTQYADLEDRFKSYGAVIHVRITPNNFGFVVFENEEPVQAILGAVKNGEKFFLKEQRLNVEEKKAAVNSNRGPRKPFNDQRSNTRRGGGRRGGAVGRSGYNDHNSDSK